MSPSKGTPARAVRIEDGIWDRVTTIAHMNGVTASDVVRSALVEWLESSASELHPADQPERTQK